MKLFLILFFILTSLSISQTTILTGKIHNQKNGSSIPYVNIGVEGTYYGTSSNEYGQFRLTLKSGLHNLIISCVGFETKKISVEIPNKKEILIKLKPISIELPEVIVNAEENPAYDIIRKAIANKEKNKAGLLNYYYDFYSKNIFKSGNDITFIEEDIGEGYNVLPNNVKELKTKLHHTENIPKSFFQQTDLNFLEKKIIDFTDDSLNLGDFVIHLPISKFAFDYYDYKLLGLQQSGDRTFYQIEIIPFSDIRPTFKGEILIEDFSYSLSAVNISLKNRNIMPFTEFEMKIIQNLIKRNNYWLPKYYNIDVKYDMNYHYLISLDSAITSFVKVFNNHSINLTENDFLLKNINRLISKDSLVSEYRKAYENLSDNEDEKDSLQNLISTADSTFNLLPEIITQSEIDSIRLYPLSLDEIKAYKNIDSTKDIVASLKLGGIGGEYVKKAAAEDKANKQIKGDENFNFGKLFKYINFQNNRVDGILLGLKYSDWVSNSINVSTEVGYALERKDIKANLTLYAPIKKSFITGIELSGNYGTKPIHVFSHYTDLWNSAAVTIGFEDQFNYYHSNSGTLKFEKHFGKKTSAKIGFTFENQKSVDAIKYYSIFNLRKKDRTNHKIIEGMDNRIVLNFKSGMSPFELNFMTTDGFISQVEFSSKLLGSNFDYTRVNAAYQFYIKTIYDELFFSPYLGVFIEAGSVFGSYRPQHLYTPQTALSVYSPFGTFKGLQPYQLVGNKSIAVHLEHNWRKTFFDMLGIYFPVAWNLELTTGLSGLRIWHRNNSNFPKIINSKDYYWEVYGGISGILGVININVAYNKFRNTVVRFGFSKFF